jgi:chemotaxis protein MotA
MVTDTTDTLAARLVALAGRAHRKGLMSLESDLSSIEDHFLRDGLTLIVDGIALEGLRDVVAMERRARDADEEAPARVFEAAAGYAPTLGILGAVLGLIQVMQHLSEPGALGAGIAVAFVATVYGVGSANLLFLPIAGRMRERAANASRRRDLIAEALFAIHARMNPRLVAQKLKVLTA